MATAPFGMEEGTEADVPGREFFLVVGAPAEFRFLGSTVRSEDVVGHIVEEWEGQIEEMAPLTATLWPMTAPTNAAPPEIVVANAGAFTAHQNLAARG